jgi:Eukaryotic aspartyl protease
MMGLSISKNCKLASIILWRSYFLCSFYAKVGTLSECPFRRFDRALSAYERNTGEPHPLALKWGHSNERRGIVSAPLTDDMNLVWTGDITVGTPPQTFRGQLLFRVAQTSKLITKCAVVFDTFTPDMFIPGDACLTCGANSFYDTSTSSTGINLQSMTNVDFSVGTVDGNVVADNVSVVGFQVSHWLKGDALMTEAPH